MGVLPRYGPPDGDAERRSYGAIASQAFAGDPANFEQWLRGIGNDVRLLRRLGRPEALEGRADSVVAGLVFYSMGQYFGGCSVGTWGVAGVAVKPEVRSQGLGRELMSALLQENFETGPPLSTLYPTAPDLYRELGWEFAGCRTDYACSVAGLPLLASPPVIRAATEADAGLIESLYKRRFASESGCLVRTPAIWQRVRRVPEDTPLCAYIAERAGEAEGYVLYTQKREVGKVRFDLLVRDLVCLTPDSARALVSFFARHSSVAGQLFFFAAPHDPLLLLTLQGSEVQVRNRHDWMLRVVRVKDALEARGYSPHVSAQAAITVRDANLPENDGNWKLALTAGKMQVSKGGKGGSTIEIRGLASLYSGGLTPTQLRTAGLLAGTEKHDPALAAMFAGPQPWMPDYF